MSDQDVKEMSRCQTPVLRVTKKSEMWHDSCPVTAMIPWLHFNRYPMHWPRLIERMQYTRIIEWPRLNADYQRITWSRLEISLTTQMFIRVMRIFWHFLDIFRVILICHCDFPYVIIINIYLRLTPSCRKHFLSMPLWQVTISEGVVQVVANSRQL